MNLTNEIREKIQLLSRGERISHYLGMLTEKKITKEVYDDILKVVLEVPYIPVVSQGNEILSDSREQRSGMDSTTVRIHDESSGYGGEVTNAVEQDTDTPTMECAGEVFISELTNGTAAAGHNKTVEDTGTSQKSKFLKLLLDGKFHSTPEIQQVVYGSDHLGCARIAARADDLRRDGYIIENRKISRSISEYRLGKQDERIAQIADNFMAG